MHSLSVLQHFTSFACLCVSPSLSGYFYLNTKKLYIVQLPTSGNRTWLRYLCQIYDLHSDVVIWAAPVMSSVACPPPNTGASLGASTAFVGCVP